MRPLASALLVVALHATRATAAPLALAWGVVGEPAATGVIGAGALAEHLEFLQAHGWVPVRTADLGRTDLPAQAVLLTFDDPASAERYVLPLLELYRSPAVVTVSATAAADPALRGTLATLGHSPWIELVPRVEVDGIAPPPAVRCGPVAPPAQSGEEATLTRLRSSLTAQQARLREIAGALPVAVAWAPGTWSGPAEAVATSLGLRRQLPTFAGMPPRLDGPRVARYAVPAWAGIWALVQAAAHWDPSEHPVRFVDVDAAWVCAGGEPQARVDRVLAVVRRLGLNGVRVRPGDASGAWFATAATPVRGEVVGPLVRALHAAGVRWVAVDVPTSGDGGRDVGLATDLARDADLDVALLPAAAAEADRLGESVRYARPAVRLGWRAEGDLVARAFHLAPIDTGQPPVRGATVGARTVAEADRQATDLAIGGSEWIGLPVELAEQGLRVSLRSLAAFALPAAGKAVSP